MKTLLAVDIGNTNVTMGIFKGNDLEVSWRFASDPLKTADEHALLIFNFLNMQKLSPQSIDGAVLCSVTPSATNPMKEAIKKISGAAPLEINWDMPSGVTILYNSPQDVGPDRIADAAAVKALYGCPSIVIDIGTALVINAINGAGEYLGGAIAPGLRMAANALFSNTAMLRNVALETPPAAIGNTTSFAIQSGLVYGFAEMTEGMVRRFKEELNPTGKEQIRVIATGGLAQILEPHLSCIDSLNQDLTLQGLKIIYYMNT